MEEPTGRPAEQVSVDASSGGELNLVAAWRAAKSASNYREEAARQAASAAHADVEDRVMEWIEGVAAESWDDL